MMHDPPVRYWHTLTTASLAEEVRRDPVVLLLLAAVEQHGPHLPLSTDLEIGMGIVAEAFRRLPHDLPAWVLPPLALGASLEHARFPGTLSLDASLLADVVHRVGRSVAAAGARRLLLFSSHGGNRHVMEEAGLRLRDELDLLVVKTHYLRFPRPDWVGIPEVEWEHGLHGGAVETAMMLHLRPELVREAEIREAPSLGLELKESLRRVGPQGEASFSWLAGDLHPSGVAGDPRLADAGTGARLVAHYGEALAEVILETRAFPLERLSGLPRGRGALRDP